MKTLLTRVLGTFRRPSHELLSLSTKTISSINKSTQNISAIQRVSNAFNKMKKAGYNKKSFLTSVDGNFFMPREQLDVAKSALSKNTKDAIKILKNARKKEGIKLMNEVNKQIPQTKGFIKNKSMHEKINMRFITIRGKRIPVRIK